LKHGGTLLFVPEEMTHEDSRLLSACRSVRLTQHTTAKCSGVGNGDEALKAATPWPRSCKIGER